MVAATIVVQATERVALHRYRREPEFQCLRPCRAQYTTTGGDIRWAKNATTIRPRRSARKRARVHRARARRLGKVRGPLSHGATQHLGELDANDFSAVFCTPAQRVLTLDIEGKEQLA